jgi:hypothetical protein
LPFRIPDNILAYSFAKGGIEWFAGSIVLSFAAAAAAYGISYICFVKFLKAKKNI